MNIKTFWRKCNKLIHTMPKKCDDKQLTTPKGKIEKGDRYIDYLLIE